MSDDHNQRPSEKRLGALCNLVHQAAGATVMGLQGVKVEATYDERLHSIDLQIDLGIHWLMRWLFIDEPLRDRFYALLERTEHREHLVILHIRAGKP